jgi:NADPH:quinone reductase-like Zn-dependent oxidoreductase
MKTLQLTGIGLESLRFADAPEPRPGPRGLLLRIRSASLNFRDLAIARGEYGSFARPLVLGSDALAEVIAIGPEVSRFTPGDRVCPTDTPDWISGPPDEASLRRRLGGPAPGVLQELLCVQESEAVRAPAALSDDEAASLSGAGVTAWQALNPLASLRAGQFVVVQGTGAVSLFTLQLARLAGARVIATSRSRAKLERVRTLGAEHLIDSAQTPEWQREVLRITDGRGADVVVDVLGGAELARSIAAARVGGTIVVLGFLAGPSAQLALPAAITRCLKIVTSGGRSRENFQDFVRAIEAGALRPVIDSVHGFADAQTAFARLGAPDLFGKVVIRIAPRG